MDLLIISTLREDDPIVQEIAEHMAEKTSAIIEAFCRGVQNGWGVQISWTQSPT